MINEVEIPLSFFCPLQSARHRVMTQLRHAKAVTPTLYLREFLDSLDSSIVPGLQCLL